MRIQIENLSKSFGPLRAIDNISLQLEPGQVIALIGPNGAGKTTLLQSLAGLIAPDKGKILFDGHSFDRERMDLRRKLLYMPDFPPLLPGGNMLQHISMALRLFEKDSTGLPEEVLAALKELDLITLAEMPVSALSRGQSYKVALAALYLVDPELWMLDEPFASGMDPHGIMSFKQRAREAASRGRIVIYTTQLLDLAERFSDQVGIVAGGKLHAFGPVAELKERSSHEGDANRGGVLEHIFAQLRETP